MRSLTPITVLLNSHFDIAPSLSSEATATERFRFVFLSRLPRRRLTQYMATEDAYVPEPLDNGPAYARFVLALCGAHDVHVILPGRRVAALAAKAAAFERRRIALITAGDSHVLRILSDKARTYRWLSRLSDLVPRHGVARSPSEFRAIAAELGAAGPICVKPTSSIFGVGFHILAPCDVSDGLRGRLIDRSTIEARLYAKHIGPQLVMEYLPGSERSVDCLASAGVLVRGIIRRKYLDGSQSVESHPEILQQVSRICDALGLSGLFNVQFKDDRQGRPRLLEINGRMAGGITKSLASGVNLPLWGIRLALGRCVTSDVPYPRVGIPIPAAQKPSVD